MEAALPAGGAAFARPGGACAKRCAMVQCSYHDRRAVTGGAGREEPRMKKKWLKALPWIVLAAAYLFSVAFWGLYG